MAGLHHVALGFAYHPNATGHLTTVAFDMGSIVKILFFLLWISQNMLHELWFLKMVVISTLVGP